MQFPKPTLPLLCILLPAAALASLNCGLFALPTTGPKAIAANARWIHFTLDLVDQDGNVLNNVAVSTHGYALSNNLVMGGTDKWKNESTRTISNGKFEYTSFGNYAVRVNVWKEGYVCPGGLFSNVDTITHPAKFLGPPETSEPCINIEKNPHQRLVLQKVNASDVPRAQP